MSPIKLVVFDWAGTTVDHGSLAPVAAFVEAFARHGVTVSAAEARAPMGLHKKDHIRSMLQLPGVAERWRQARGAAWHEADVELLFRTFIPLQLEVIGQHCGLVPGLGECVAHLRSLGVKIGATTGYFAEAARRVYDAAARQGYAPDLCLCAEDVHAGRPAPWMMFRIMQQLDVYPSCAVVKVGDTVPDVAEGRNAGAWSVGVVATGSEVACSEAEYRALGEAERSARLDAARRKLRDAGAHAVMDSVADLPALLPQLARRLEGGERP